MTTVTPNMVVFGDSTWHYKEQNKSSDIKQQQTFGYHE